MSIAAKIGGFFCDMAGVKHGDSIWVALEERDHKEVMEAILQRAQVLEPGQVLVVPVSIRAAQSVGRLQKQVEEDFKIRMLWAPVGDASGGLAVVKRQDLPPVEVEPEPVKVKPEPNTPDGLVKKLKTQVRELNKTLGALKDAGVGTRLETINISQRDYEPTYSGLVAYVKVGVKWPEVEG